MQACELLREYERYRVIGAGTKVWFESVISRWSRFLGREPCDGDFIDDGLNDWIAFLLAEGRLSKHTIHGYRRAVLMLWRFGFAEGHFPVAPRQIRPVKVPSIIPSGWSAAEVDQLLSAAASEQGEFRKSKVPRRAFWIALLLVLWDTGLRLGDVLRLERKDFSATDGRGAIVQGKTGWPVYFGLRPRTLAAIASTFPAGATDRKRVFGDALSRRWILAGMKCLATRAGLVGGTKKIRKGGASAVEREQPGAAMHYLGHRTPGLAARYYLDPRIVGVDPPRPPELLG